MWTLLDFNQRWNLISTFGVVGRISGPKGANGCLGETKEDRAGRHKDKVRTASFLAPGHASSLLFVICPYLKRTEKEGDFMHIKRGVPREV